MSAVRTGWKEIQDGYNLFKECPYYALFDSNGRSKAGRLLFSYKGDDRAAEGWDLLKENLQIAEQNSPSTTYCLMFYSDLGKSGRIDSNTPYDGSFNLCMQTYQGRALAGVTVSAQENNSFLAYLQRELDQAKETIRGLQEDKRELEEELEEATATPKTDKIDGVIGQIGGVGNEFPWIADLIKDWSTVLKHKFSAGPPAPSRPAGARMAGVDTDTPPDAPPDVRINLALRKLGAWYIREYGKGATDDEKHESGFQQFGKDMQALAALTADDDVMHLALKKLRAF